MPRVAGIYSRPTGIDAVANNTIDSGKYNSNVADVEADLNLPRPTIAGGTGANNPAEARSNLQTEVAMQVVTNFDLHPWEPGSVVAAPGATNAPVAGHWFIGSYYGDNLNSSLQIRDISTALPFKVYVRVRIGGAWGFWSTEDSANDKVNKAGDTMTGDLVVSRTTPHISLLTPNTATQADYMFTSTSIGNRWWVSALGDANGGDFGISRFNISGVFQDFPLRISRSTGFTNIGGTPGTSPGWTNTQTGIELQPAGTMYASRAAQQAYAANTNIDGWCATFSRSGTMVGSVNVTTTTTSYLTTSDGTLKEDLQPAGITASQILNDTEIFNFRWKGTDERAFGVIAQQAAPIYPGPFFHSDSTDRWFVDYSKYIPLLIQEAKTLKTRIADLETKFTAATSRLDVLDEFRKKIEAL